MEKKELCTLLFITATEFLHPTGNVYQFLLPGDERMAFGADTDFLFLPCGHDFPSLAAGADHFRRPVVRMNSRFHFANPVNMVIV